MALTEDNRTTDAADATPAAPGPAAATGGARHWTGAPGDSPWLAAATALIEALAEAAAGHDRRGDFVTGELDLVRAHRVLSMLVPAELAGGGASFAETCAVLSTLARGCPATALTLSMHQHLVAAQVWRHHRDLPAPVLARVAADQILLVSTGASDWMDSDGSARPVDGGYVVSARKSPSSGAPAGAVLVTSVRWDDGPDGPQVIHAAVPFSAPGVRVEETWDTLGMRATGSHTVVLDEVFVPDAAVALTRPAGVWHPVWATVLGVALPLIMSVYVGVAETAAERAIALARTRGDLDGQAPLVGRLVTRLTAARDSVAAMISAADDLTFDNSVDHADTTLARKTLATEAVIDVARLALEVGGGAAFSLSGGIERLFRDLHGSLYHPLPAARQERFTGRIALGLDPITG